MAPARSAGAWLWRPGGALGFQRWTEYVLPQSWPVNLPPACPGTVSWASLFDRLWFLTSWCVVQGDLWSYLAEAT